MRTLRWVLIGLAGLLALAVGGIAIVLATLDAETLKPEIASRVEEATGRRLTIAGPIRIGYSLIPTVVAEDVAFANMPGGSRPEMARIGRVEIHLAVVPLLTGRVELRAIRLVDPDILLETDAEGRPNWAFAPARATPPPVAAPGAPATSPPPASSSAAGRVDIGEISILRGQVTWRDGRAGTRQALGIPSLDVQPRGSAGPVAIRGAVHLAGLDLRLEGETGALLAPARDAPWPFRLALSGTGLDLRAEGALARPGAVEDWTARIAMQAAELERLQPLVDIALPGTVLPPLRDLRLSTAATRERGALRIGATTASLGATALDALREGLRVTRLEIAAPAPDQPIRVAGEGALGALALAVTGTLGAPAALMPGATRAPFPIDLALTAGGARATVTGQLADPRRLAGAALAVTVQAEDIAVLAPLAGRPLPALGALDARARVTTGEQGLAGPVRLAALRVVAPATALEGELELRVAPRPALRGHLEGPRLDVDALRAAFGAPGTAPTPGAAPAAPQRDAAARRVIPATPLPLDVLRLADAELRFAVAELRANGVVYRDLVGTLALENGRARLQPFAVTLPGGRITGTLAADANESPPALRIVARHEGEPIDLGTLLAAYNAPRHVTGRLELDVDLAGRGADLRAFAGSAGGHLGLAMVGGRIERSLMSALPEQIRGLLGAGSEGGIALRCFALRAPARDGVLRSDSFLADTALGRVGGGGTINLGSEALALRLLPDLRVGPVQLRAPVNVGGTLAAPRVATTEAAGAAAAGAIGALLGAQRSPDRSAQALAEALGGGGPGAPALPDCATVLTAARGGRAGAAAPAGPSSEEAGTTTPAAPAPAAPQPAPTPRQQPVLPRAAEDVLRGFLGGGRR